MIEIEVRGGSKPEALAELIASTIHGQPVMHPAEAVAGRLVREHQEAAESRRPSVHDMETVNYATVDLDPDTDWTDL